MHALSEPPGQSLGLGLGDGVGVGDGDGVGTYGGLQSVHHFPSQSEHCDAEPLQYAVVSPQYSPSQEQQPPDGDGDGPGAGDGVGPPLVEPMAPNLISEKVTLALACLDSTSFGTPDVVGQLPRAAPGSVESTGYVESSQSMLA